MSKSNAPSENTMDQIRQLLFGQQVDALNEKFNSVTGEVAALQKRVEQSLDALQKSIDTLKTTNEEKHQELRSQISDLDKNFQDRLQDLDTRLSGMIKSCDQNSVQRSTLAEYLIEMGERLQTGKKVQLTNGQSDALNNDE